LEENPQRCPTTRSRQLAVDVNQETGNPARMKDFQTRFFVDIGQQGSNIKASGEK
jgi:hypothetical protein